MEVLLLVWLALTLMGSSITSAQSDQYSKAMVSFYLFSLSGHPFIIIKIQIRNV